MPSSLKPVPERHETDQSLRVERQKADSEFGRRSSKIEEGSDVIVQKAQDRADDVLEEARVRADEKLSRDGSSAHQRASVRQERVEADAALEAERTSADEKTSKEREERKRALTNLLRLEREETDERLVIERARGDAAVAARDDFMGLVSHDLRTLLGGIALTAELQIQNSGEDEAGRRSLLAALKIQRLTARINRLVGDLVDVASIEAGRFSVEAKDQDAIALIHDSVEAFQPMAAAKDLSLIAEASLKSGGLTAHFDHERVLQVLANLLSNAIKFTGKGGSVVLRVERVQEGAQFSITDTGEGIPSDQLQSVFERFWQMGTSDRRGLGLGLFISKCIVEAHGGRIWAVSKVRSGSTFCFTLPLARPPNGSAAS